MNAFDPITFAKAIFSPDFDFEHGRKALWDYQRKTNPVIHDFCKELRNDSEVFIPIEFFKSFEMKSGWETGGEAIFESSGTTGQQPSKHYVKDLSLYKRTALEGFHQFFPRQPYRILALLPSYIERGNSSLVHMVKVWIETFGLPGSGFYLQNFDALAQAIFEGGEAGDPILLIGVSFALLDFANHFADKFPKGTIVMETGGMKGQREELVRSELHSRLCDAFGPDSICSEYGMTELMSQAYALNGGRFRTPPWMKVVISDIHLNTLVQAPGISGRINIIDLANIHSCAFISTDDIGRMHADGSFEVLGRLDYAEMRGCNLMYV